jgi:YD repeat-containing protein
VPNGKGHDVLAYDGLGRPIQERFKSAHDYDFAGSYDQLGQLATRTYPNGRTVVWQKDTRGYPTGVVGQLASQTQPYASAVSWMRSVDSRAGRAATALRRA